LECIDLATTGGDVLTLPTERLGLAYRSSSLPDGIVLNAVFQLEQGNKNRIQLTTKQNMDTRGRTQPILTPNAGSFFKNPPGHHAAQLIEEAGCKGWEEGDAEVSTLHANFIVNHGRASAAQVLKLADRVREQVAKTFGVLLEMEVKTVGEM
jgi:UDP-N-acetylmuramate dehydrogenase